MESLQCRSGRISSETFWSRVVDIPLNFNNPKPTTEINLLSKELEWFLFSACRDLERLCDHLLGVKRERKTCRSHCSVKCYWFLCLYQSNVVVLSEIVDCVILVSDVLLDFMRLRITRLIIKRQVVFADNSCDVVHVRIKFLIETVGSSQTPLLAYDHTTTEYTVNGKRN